MSKNKPFKNEIEQIYRNSFEDNALYFYYIGIKQILPNVSDSKIVQMWLEKMDYTEDDYPLRTALNTLLRMKHVFLKKNI